MPQPPATTTYSRRVGPHEAENLARACQTRGLALHHRYISPRVWHSALYKLVRICYAWSRKTRPVQYDFTGVPLVYRDQAKKWCNAPRPSSSRKYIATHPEVLSVYNSWLKWNLTKVVNHISTRVTSLGSERRRLGWQYRELGRGQGRRVLRGVVAE